MNLSLNERKLISIFKTFIEKVFVPHLPKMDPTAMKEWNTFSKMINTDAVNLGEVQVYIDTLSTPSQSLNAPFYDRNRNKSPININSSKKQSSENSFSLGGFNPSKTMGGQRTRIAIQMKMDQEKPSFYNTSRQSKQTSIKEDKNVVTTLSLQPILEKLFSTFSNNQSKLQKGKTSGQTNYSESMRYPS